MTTTQVLNGEIMQFVLPVGTESGNTSYTALMRFVFAGKLAWGAPTGAKAVSWNDNGNSSIRIQDVTNGQTICELASNTLDVAGIADLGAIANVPDGEALWEVQVKRPGGPPSSTFLESLALSF